MLTWMGFLVQELPGSVISSERACSHTPVPERGRAFLRPHALPEPPPGNRGLWAGGHRGSLPLAAQKWGAERSRSARDPRECRHSPAGAASSETELSPGRQGMLSCSSLLEMGSGGGSAGTQLCLMPPEHVPTVAQLEICGFFGALAPCARCFSRFPEKLLKSRACLENLFSRGPAHPRPGSLIFPGFSFLQVLPPLPSPPRPKIVFPGAPRPGRPNHTLNHSCDKGPGDSPRVLLLPRGPYFVHLQGKQLCRPRGRPAEAILPSFLVLWDRLGSAEGSSLCGVTRSVAGCWSPVSHPAGTSPPRGSRDVGRTWGQPCSPTWGSSVPRISLWGPPGHESPSFSLSLQWVFTREQENIAGRVWERRAKIPKPAQMFQTAQNSALGRQDRAQDRSQRPGSDPWGGCDGVEWPEVVFGDIFGEVAQEDLVLPHPCRAPRSLQGLRTGTHRG